MKRKIGVITSGGDSPGMNAALRAVVRSGIASGVSVVGFFAGYDGIIDNRYMDMDVGSVSGIINRGGTILRTARSARFMKKEGRLAALETLRKHRCDSLVVIGGDGSFRGAEVFSKEFNFPVIGVPGSIDNDIGGTDYSIGFDTAVNTAIMAIDKIRETAESHDRVFVIEVMGRTRGFIAIEAAMAGGAEGLLVPEVKPDLDRLSERIKRGHNRGKTSSIIIVSEGAGGADMHAHPEDDNLPRNPDISISYKVANAIFERTGLEVRVCVLGHLQRGGPPSAYDRSLASQLSAAAVDLIIGGSSGIMVGRQSGKIVASPFSDAWEKCISLDCHMLDLVERLGR